MDALLNYIFIPEGFFGGLKDQSVAVKCLKIDNVTLHVSSNMLLKEVEELQSLEHLKVVKFHLTSILYARLNAPKIAYFKRV